jgi:hypothetical protein
MVNHSGALAAVLALAHRRVVPLCGRAYGERNSLSDLLTGQLDSRGVQHAFAEKTRHTFQVSAPPCGAPFLCVAVRQNWTTYRRVFPRRSCFLVQLRAT